MSDASPFQSERARRELLEQFVEMLTDRASDPARIGKRVLTCKQVLETHGGIGAKLKDFAEHIKVSESTASIAVSDMKQKLDEIIKSKSQAMR